MRYFVIFLLLTGCVTQEQRAERDIARFSPYCEKMGYERNTDQWRECVVNRANRPKRAPTEQHCTSDGYGGVNCTSY